MPGPSAATRSSGREPRAASAVHGTRGDTGRGAAPARVRGRDEPPPRVHEEDGQAVGGLDAEEPPGTRSRPTRPPPVSRPRAPRRRPPRGPASGGEAGRWPSSARATRARLSSRVSLPVAGGAALEAVDEAGDRGERRERWRCGGPSRHASSRAGATLLSGEREARGRRRRGERRRAGRGRGGRAAARGRRRRRLHRGRAPLRPGAGRLRAGASPPASPPSARRAASSAGTRSSARSRCGAASTARRRSGCRARPGRGCGRSAPPAPW